MANKSVGLLTIAFGADLRGFEKAMKKAQKSIKKFGSSMQKTGKNLTRNLTLPLVALGAASIRNFDIQAKAIAQVEAGLKSTGNLVGKTSKQLQQMAADLQTKTLFGDEEILKNATAQLLTFTNIAGNQFEKTQEIALDLATRLDGDLKSASIMLGKALNDPVANLSALSRAGIQFSKEQKDLVKSLVETNRLADAQTIILAELEKQYGGSAEAARNTGAGALQGLAMQLSDISEKIGKMLLPIVIEMGNVIKDIATSFTNLDEDTKKVIVTIGILAGAIGPLLLLVGSLTIAFAALFTPGGAILVGILAVGAGFIYISENFEAMKERLSDWSWWKNSLINAAQQMILIFGGPIARKLGITQAVLKLEKDTKEYENEFGTFADAIKAKAEDLTDVFLKLGKSFGLGSSGGGGGGDSKKDLFGRKTINGITSGGFGIGSMNKVAEKTKELTQAQLEYNAAMTMFEGIMSAAMTSAAHSTDEFFKGFIEAIKQSIKQLLIQLAVAIVIKSLFGFDTEKYSSAFQAAKGGVLGLAKGGLVTGPTMALVGEGAGTTASNPEVVAPLDKLKGMINNNGGGGGKIEVFGRISGNDIFLSNQKSTNSRFRSV